MPGDYESFCTNELSVLLSIKRGTFDFFITEDGQPFIYPIENDSHLITKGYQQSYMS